MKMKKMIVMDLDGTLLNNEKRVSEETRKYLNKLKQEGYIIAIATGRILKSALIATEGAEFANYIITDAGAAVYKSSNKNNEWKEIYADFIPKEIAISIIYEFDDEKYNYIDICEKDYAKRYTKGHFKSRLQYIKYYTDRDEIIKDINRITHIAVFLDKNELIKEERKKFIEKYPELDINIMQDSFDNMQWLELCIKGIKKYSGIYKIAQIENIDNKDIIAFGDGLNDIEMIESCGVGVAMKNALQDIKDKADFVTDKSNYEDGIVDFLEKYL